MPMTPSPSPALPDALSHATAAAINHVLEPESWARARLKAHAGKVARFDLGLVALAFHVDADGLVRRAEEGALPQVTIRIKPADLPLIAQHRERAFSYVTIEGDAEFANTISQLSQTVRWEIEDDLSRLIGDIAAARMVSGAKSVLHTIAATHRKLAETTAEYFLEENPMLIRPQSVRDFAAEVARLRDDVARTAKRIERLTGNTQ